MSFHEWQEEMSNRPDQWSENQIEEIARNEAKALLEVLEGSFFNRILDLEDTQIDLKNKIDSLSENVNTHYDVEERVEKIEESLRSKESRKQNLKKEGLKSALTTSQLALLTQELQKQRVITAADTDISRAYANVFNTGFESFRKALGRKRPSTDSSEQSDKVYYKNLREILMLLYEMTESVKGRIKSVENAVTIEDRDKLNL